MNSLHPGLPNSIDIYIESMIPYFHKHALFFCEPLISAQIWVCIGQYRFALGLPQGSVINSGLVWVCLHTFTPKALMVLR